MRYQDRHGQTYLCEVVSGSGDWVECQSPGLDQNCDGSKVVFCGGG